MWNLGFHNEGRDSQKMDERNYDRRVLVEQRKEREVAVTKNQYKHSRKGFQNKKGEKRKENVHRIFTIMWVHKKKKQQLYATTRNNNNSRMHTSIDSFSKIAYTNVTLLHFANKGWSTKLRKFD